MKNWPSDETIENIIPLQHFKVGPRMLHPRHLLLLFITQVLGVWLRLSTVKCKWLIFKDLVFLQSKFLPATFFFCVLEKGILAGKNLLFKRVNLFCKKGFFPYFNKPFNLMKSVDEFY
jgi:hypothetical protein